MEYGLVHGLVRNMRNSSGNFRQGWVVPSSSFDVKKKHESSGNRFMHGGFSISIHLAGKICQSVDHLFSLSMLRHVDLGVKWISLGDAARSSFARLSSFNVSSSVGEDASVSHGARECAVKPPSEN